VSGPEKGESYLSKRGSEERMALCGVSCLKSFCILLAGLLFLVSCAGIAFSLYMLFGEPFAQRSGNTYRPNWENIGPCLFASLISLVMNLLLGGAAVQGSRKLLTAWLAWHLALLLLYWAWFTYSLLKHHGYIDWRTVGMRECYWCTLDIIETVGFGSALASVLLILSMGPVQVFRTKLAKLGRTQSTYLLQNYPASSQPDYYPPHQQQQGYYPPHQQQGRYPSQDQRVQQEEDWSNGYPDQQGDYPAELGYYPKANGQNPAVNGGYPPHIRQQYQQQQHQQQHHQQHQQYQQQQFAAAGSRYIDQLNAQQQHYY